MELRLRIIIFISAIIVLGVIINMIRNEKLDLKYALSWILIDISIIIISIFPNIIDIISNILGVASPMNAVFFIGFIFELIIIYSLTIAQSKNSQKLKCTVQKIALLEYKIRSDEKLDD